VEQGVREITLLGQNVNHYRDGEFGFAECLRVTARVPASPACASPRRTRDT